MMMRRFGWLWLLMVSVVVSAQAFDEVSIPSALGPVNQIEQQCFQMAPFDDTITLSGSIPQGDEPNIALTTHWHGANVYQMPGTGTAVTHLDFPTQFYAVGLGFWNYHPTAFGGNPKCEVVIQTGAENSWRAYCPGISGVAEAFIVPALGTPPGQVVPIPCDAAMVMGSESGQPQGTGQLAGFAAGR